MRISLAPQQPAAIAAIDQLIPEARRFQRKGGCAHQARTAFFAVEPRDGPTAAAQAHESWQWPIWQRTLASRPTRQP
jgi:hypothetical protein